MMYTDAVQAAPDFLQRINEAHRILILSHVNPDGDAIGSLLGVWHALQALGKEAIPLASSETPVYSQWLPGYEHVHVYEHGMPLPDADLVLLVDTATLPRVGPVYAEHAEELHRLPLLIVDHHVTNQGDGTLNLIVTHAAATCEILYHLFQAMAVEINPSLATCLLLGLTTDTQSYQTSATRASSLHVAGDLLAQGADHYRIVHEVYYALPPSSAALIGLSIEQMRIDHGVAWTFVTQAMMQITGAEDEAADEVTRMMQRVAGTKALVLFKERVDGTTKISLRSSPSINVATLAQTWGGGGHAQASGATLLMTPAQAAEEVLPRLRELVATYG
jgi:phosphoesterase RecJ-like protein